MATSLVPLVKSHLIEALQADPRLAGVHVAYARDTKDARRESIVFVGQREQSEPGPMRSGRKSRTETVSLELLVNAATPGQTPEAAEARAYEIRGVIEDVIAEDPKVGLDAVFVGLGVTVESADSGPQLDGGFEGWEGLCRLRLSYTARLH